MSNQDSETIEKTGPGPAPHDVTDSTCKVDIPDEVRQKMKRKRAQIMVHSYIYYCKFKNIVSDETWDQWGKELGELQDEYGYQIGYYDEDFKGFDGTTGYDLPKNKYVKHKANNILRVHQQKEITQNTNDIG